MLVCACLKQNQNDRISLRGLEKQDAYGTITKGER